MNDKIILTNELIHSCETENGGFTNAQIEFLGLNPKEKWISQASGIVLDQEEFDTFAKYGNTKAKELRRLKKNGDFHSLAPQQIDSFNITTTDTNGTKQQNTSSTNIKHPTINYQNELKDGELYIYTDGACEGNPGKSASGVAMFDKKMDKPILLGGDYAEHGTNNTAELNALHHALQVANENKDDYTQITIYSDSMYSINASTKWADKWKKDGWTKKGAKIKNLELVQKNHQLYKDSKEKVSIQHVKGHNGILGNELADRMAVNSIKNTTEKYTEFQYSTLKDILDMENDL